MESKKPQVTTFRASYENLSWLREMAIQEDRSVSWLINSTISKARLRQQEAGDERNS